MSKDVKRICIDFDGTIVDEVRFPEKGRLKSNVAESILKLKDLGYYISIYSCRNNKEIYNQRERFKQMVDILSENDIYYDEIILDPKPVSVFFIDDRAIRFNTWSEVLNRIMEEIGV